MFFPLPNLITNRVDTLNSSSYQLGIASCAFIKTHFISGRKRQKREGKRRLEQSSPEKVSSDLERACCDNNCIQNLTFRFICATREAFWNLVVSEQRVKISDHRKIVLGDVEKCILEGILVCTECWRIVHGVSKSRLVQAYSMSRYISYKQKFQQGC